MTRNEFRNIKIGEELVITTHGRNKGKRGIVREIKSNDEGPCIVYLEPVDCVFEFCSDYGIWRIRGNLYGWNSYGISYPNKLVQDKQFTVSVINEKEDDEVIRWSTENFTLKQLGVITRFLKELNAHVDMDTCSYVNIEISN